VTNNVHTAIVKNDWRLTKQLPLNRVTGTIHHYLASSASASCTIIRTPSPLSLPPSLPFSRPSSLLLLGSLACNSIISRLRFTRAIPEGTTYSRQVTHATEFIKDINGGGERGYTNTLRLSLELTAKVHRHLLVHYTHYNSHGYHERHFH